MWQALESILYTYEREISASIHLADHDNPEADDVLDTRKSFLMDLQTRRSIRGPDGHLGQVTITI